MSGKIYISHSVPDTELVQHLVDFFEATLDPDEIHCTSLPGYTPRGTQPPEATVKHPLQGVDLVLGLITPAAIESGEAAFQLGAAWALGKPIIGLLGEGVSRESLALPFGAHEPVELDSLGAVVSLAREMSGLLGTGFDLSEEASEALEGLIPVEAAAPPSSVIPPSAESGSTQQQWRVSEEDAAAVLGAASDEATPDEPESGAAGANGHDSLPSCVASLDAGRAFSDCVFNREEGGPFAEELDLAFGGFVASLGGNWSQLREMEDVDVWTQMADNVLDGLADGADHVRSWYEVGYQVSTLLNLVNYDGNKDVAELVVECLAALDLATASANIQQQSAGDLHAMFANLLGPESQRDYTNMGRVQETLREVASLADGPAR